MAVVGAREQGGAGGAVLTGRGFALVEAKFHAPTSREGMIHRGELIRRLGAARDGRIAAVVAPPGYGKTTLLAQWAAIDRRRTAWLTVGDGENDPAVLFAYLAAALERVDPLGDPVADSLGAPSHRVLTTVVPRIASALHDWERPARIVLDDLHRLTDRTCLDALAELIEHLPRNVHLAFGARTQPGLPLARLRASARLIEIGAADLAFDERETAEAAIGFGDPSAADDLRRLWERTEGWPAGIYLATLGRSRAPLRSPTVDASGRDPYIADYLRSEVLAALPDEDITLLTRSSVLETVGGPETAEVVDIPDADGRLAHLALANPLIARLPTDEPHYRYHLLLREFLIQELERREPGATPLLHRRAAAAFASRRQFGEAVEHALAAGDTDAAARLVTAIGLPTFFAGRGGTLEHWLRAFDEDVYERHPPLAVLSAWFNALAGRPAEADRLARIVERSTFVGPPGDGTASFQSGRSMLEALMCRRGPDDALANAAFAADQEGVDSPWRTVALIMHGAGWLMVGDPARADERFAEAIEAAAPTGANPMVAFAERALLALRRGDVRAAERFVAEAEVALRRGHFAEIASALVVHAAAARVAIALGDPTRARQAIAHAQTLRPLGTYALPWFSVHSFVELGRAHLALADPPGARRLVRDAESIVRVRPALGTLVLELADLRRRLAEEETMIGGATSLTNAELRLLPLLPTYLSFQDIADRLFLSRNTVKTQALSLYGKLGAASRGEAVQQAIRLGLIEPFPGLDLGPRDGDGRGTS